MIQCTNCHLPYPELSVPYHCPKCGGIFDYVNLFSFDSLEGDTSLPGIWRYRRSFGLSEACPVVSLGEGNTPLVWAEAFGQPVGFKCEYQNPTGSFKDRGSPLLASILLSRGITLAVEDSSGNAGASLAAYASRVGLKARIYIPDSVSGPKLKQIASYGAEISRIMGPRSNSAEAVRRAADQGVVYASHAYLPFNLAGYATLAYELVEQMGATPGTVILPVGQGGLLLGIGRGFEAMENAGVINQIPRLVGVQARACAPLWALFSYGSAGMGWVSEAHTVAEGIRVRYPVRGDAVIKMVEKSHGLIVSVDEESILPACEKLARFGFYVEPTSAVVWEAINQLNGRIPGPVVVVLTGSGFKAPE